MKKINSSNLNGRTEKVAINAIVTLICQFLTLILSFINRTVFIYVLGVEYLGINGLFTNIFTLLSFAELGIGSAITFHLYKPLNENNTDEIRNLVKLYSKIYNFIGVIIIILGLSLIPFLPRIIGEAPNIKESINLIYVLFILNLSISYFFTYKSTIIIADQKNYIVVLIRQVITLLSTIFQMIILYYTKNYILFLVFQIVTTLIINISIALKANKMYPYIKDLKNITIEKSKLKKIFNDAKSLLVYRGASVVLDGTDNIIISLLYGIQKVGYASNYTMIINSISSIFKQVITSFTASIGNLNIESDSTKSKDVFYKLLFVCFWIYSLGSVLLLTLTNDFINIWLGDKYTLENIVLIGLVITFYIQGIQMIPYMYRTTMGLFREGRIAPVLAIICNIFLSIILGKLYGVGGIFLATGISRFLTMGIVDPILIYRKKFNDKTIKYYKKIFLYSFTWVIGFFITNHIVELIINVNNIVMFILKAIVVFIIYNIFIFIFYFHTREFKELISIIKKLLFKHKTTIVRGR